MRDKVRAEAEEVLRTKPTTLLGSEMIFEITTALQDVLDHEAQGRVHNIPTLEEERVTQQAAVFQKVQKEQEERRKLQHQASVEEEQFLAEMVEKQRAQDERRRAKMHTEPSQDIDASSSKLAFRASGST